MVTCDMNVIAITNRSIVASQIAIGQVVALASWTNMIHEFTGNLETIGDWIQWIPCVGPIIEKLTEVMHKGTSVLRNAIKTGSVSFIFAQDQIIILLVRGERFVTGSEPGSFLLLDESLPMRWISSAVTDTPTNITGALWKSLSTQR